MWIRSCFGTVSCPRRICKDADPPVSLYPDPACQWYLNNNLQRLHVETLYKSFSKDNMIYSGLVTKVLWFREVAGDTFVQVGTFLAEMLSTHHMLQHECCGFVMGVENKTNHFNTKYTIYSVLKKDPTVSIMI